MAKLTNILKKSLELKEALTNCTMAYNELYKKYQELYQKYSYEETTDKMKNLQKIKKELKAGGQ